MSGTAMLAETPLSAAVLAAGKRAISAMMCRIPVTEDRP